MTSHLDDEDLEMPLAVRGLDLRGWMLAGNAIHRRPVESRTRRIHRPGESLESTTASNDRLRLSLPRDRAASIIALGLASRHSLRAFIAQRGPRRLALVGDAPYRMDVGAEDLTDANNAFGEAGFLISWSRPGRRSAAVERRRFSPASAHPESRTPLH